MDARKSFVLRGGICHSNGKDSLETFEDGYLVCDEGICQGAYRSLPGRYRKLPVEDLRDHLILPGTIDLHVHAPQFAFRGLGLDLELLHWLRTRAFPEEAKYDDLGYAERAYSAFVDDIRRGPNTRAVVFATRHVPATRLLMNILEESGLVTMVGKVNMDRNAPEELREKSSERSLQDTEEWLRICQAKGYANTHPILTPRFTPACTDGLLEGLGEMQRQYKLPVQSHLSENRDEVEWVRKLCPWAKTYGESYDRWGLFGDFDGEDVPTIMAHCVWAEDDAEAMRENGVYVAHCPQSNTNLSSGIAPIRRYLNKGLRVGLGSDVAGGSDTSIFRVMRSAIEVSKLYWRLVDRDCRPLSLAEAFYLGTAGGGAFFGNVGRFAPEYEFDAVVLDDGNLRAPFDLSIEERVARAVYYADDRNIRAKYVRGVLISMK